MKNCYKQPVQKDIPHRRSDEKIQRRLAVSQAVEDSRSYVIEKQENKTADIDSQIQRAVCKNILGRIHQDHHAFGSQKPDHQKQGGQHQTADHGSRDCGFQIPVPLCAKELAHHNGAADLASDRDCHKDHSDGIAGAYCRQCVLPCEPSGDHTVCDIIDLLKYHAHKHGKRKPPKHSSRLSHS